MQKVLSLPLPNLKQVYFRTAAIKTVIEARKRVSAQTLTPKLLRLLFGSSYFTQLRVLDLSGTNIDDRYLEFIAEGRNSAAALEMLRLCNAEVTQRTVSSVAAVSRLSQRPSKRESSASSAFGTRCSSRTDLRRLCWECSATSEGAAAAVRSARSISATPTSE